MRLLLDTCVVSELTRPRPSQAVLDWFAAQDEQELFLCALSIGEIQMGIELLAPGKRKDYLTAWLGHGIIPRFAGRILSLDVPVLLDWGRVVAPVRKSGSVPPVPDSLIAACAIHHEMSLVTRNEADFANLGLRVVNPWRLTTQA